MMAVVGASVTFVASTSSAPLLWLAHAIDAAEKKSALLMRPLPPLDRNQRTRFPGLGADLVGHRMIAEGVPLAKTRSAPLAG
jgi:hypothetical protein